MKGGPVGLEKLSLDAICRIDAGRVAVAFEQALRRAEEDCRDRPGVSAARKVSMTVVIEPKATEEGDLSSVDVNCEIKESIPTRKSQTYNMAATPGGLFFNELSPEDINQRTLDLTEPRDVSEPDSTSDVEVTNAG
jgi:hypothetical protein